MPAVIHLFCERLSCSLHLQAPFHECRCLPRPHVSRPRSALVCFASLVPFMIRDIHLPKALVPLSCFRYVSPCLNLILLSYSERNHEPPLLFHPSLIFLQAPSEVSNVWGLMKTLFDGTSTCRWFQLFRTVALGAGNRARSGSHALAARLPQQPHGWRDEYQARNVCRVFDGSHQNTHV